VGRKSTNPTATVNDGKVRWVKVKTLDDKLDGSRTCGFSANDVWRCPITGLKI
jgi:predicted RNA-binding protein with TRAM domain